MISIPGIRTLVGVVLLISLAAHASAQDTSDTPAAPVLVSPEERSAAKFFVVDGIALNDALNVRASASPVGMVIGRLPNGAQLRNLGCDTIRDALWCKVSDVANPTLSGWSPARYLLPATLTEADLAAAGQSPADAVPAGPRVLEIPCARHFGQPMTYCSVSATGGAKGEATVVVTWPDGGDRLIRFRDGKPNATDGDTLTFTREDTLNLIRIGKDERFEILDAVAFGG